MGGWGWDYDGRIVSNTRNLMAIRLIVGCGYVGERIARKWIQAGDEVFAVARKASRIQELASMGIRPICWDWLDANGPKDLNSRELFQIEPKNLTLLISVSHAPVPGIPFAETHVRGLSNLVGLLQERVRDYQRIRTIYLSTTGVFGSSAQDIHVDEATIPVPESPGAVAAFHAEKWIQELPLEESVVLRPAGIYGPGRVPNWQSLRDKIPIHAEPKSYLNLIHVEDLVSIIEAVSNRCMSHQLYCVCDNEPVTRQEYYGELAAIGKWQQPVFEPQKDSSNLDASPKRRRSGNKRVLNTRIVSELNYQFIYPSYREGLRSLFDGNAGCSHSRVT